MLDAKSHATKTLQACSTNKNNLRDFDLIVDLPAGACAKFLRAQK